MVIYITDKSGARHFRTDVTDDYSIGERRNLERHLHGIQSGDRAYARTGIDPATAKIAVQFDIDLDKLAAELEDFACEAGEG